MDAREELIALRRLAELEAKAGGAAPQQPRQAPGSEGKSSTFGERMSRMGQSALQGLVTGGPTGMIAGAGKESMGQFADFMDRAAYDTGGKVTDVLAPHVSPEVAGGAGYIANVATQAIPVAIGTAAGRAVDPAIKAPFKWAGRKFMNVVDPWLPGGIERSVGRTAVQAAGPKLQAVIDALRQNRQIVPGSAPTAGEVAAPAGSAEFSGLQRVSQGRLPSEYVAREGVNEGARSAAVQSVGGTADDLAAAIKFRGDAADEAYGAIRHNRIGPESNAQIMERAIRERSASKASALQDQGRFATTAAQQDELANNFVPVAGQPRVPARLSNNLERVGEARSAATDAGVIARGRRSEQEFLESTMDLLRQTVGMEKTSMSALLNRPSMKSAVQDAIKSAQEGGHYFPSQAGEKLSIQNLQRIKESLDAGIRAAKASADAGRRPTLSPAELESTKKEFVRWLSSRSDEWKNARLQYFENSLPINRMEVGQELEKALKNSLGTGERPNVFAGAVENAPRTLKRATGQPRFEKLSDVLDPRQTQTVTNVLDDLKRTADYETLAKAGSEKASELIGGIAPKAPALGMFNPKYSVARSIAARVAGRVEGKSIDKLAEDMLDPKKMADLMEAASAAQRQAIVQALTGQRALGGTLGGTTGGVYGYESGRPK